MAPVPPATASLETAWDKSEVLEDGTVAGLGDTWASHMRRGADPTVRVASPPLTSRRGSPLLGLDRAMTAAADAANDLGLPGFSERASASIVIRDVVLRLEVD
ncbi:hypothetical protein GCM10015536_64490 [Streptomyces griseomycini]|nr:hypothetical protein GCM10015536_64490 [Streptomyces griseomycini]